MFENVDEDGRALIVITLARIVNFERAESESDVAVDGEDAQLCDFTNVEKLPDDASERFIFFVRHARIKFRSTST